jgi:hypothetical protein
MFPRRSCHLAPLTNLTGKRRFVWNPEHQKAFQIMKALIAQDCMLRYPDHNKPFDVYTDASDYQLGTIIIQEGVPVVYLSQKLTKTQKSTLRLRKNFSAYSQYSRLLIQCYSVLK